VILAPANAALIPENKTLRLEINITHIYTLLLACIQAQENREFVRPRCRWESNI
jgi:hypothetical protein